MGGVFMLNQSIQPSITNEVLSELAVKYHEQLSEEAVNYLNSRRVELESIAKFLIGYEQDQIGFRLNTKDFSGHFRNRIIFPLITKDEKIVDLIGRSLDGKEPKYKSLVGIEDVFFNERVLASSEDVLFCNSIFDVISLDQAKLPAVCMIDNRLKENQIEKITGKRVFLCFGNDEAGRRETIRIVKAISERVKDLYIIHLPEGFKDINDFFIRVQNPVDEFINLVNETLKNSIIAPIAPDSKYLIHFQEEYIKRNKGILSGIETGFKSLDDLLIGGLQEGLYLIGGNVSAGKNTFFKQIADQMAERIPVIFITWDMTSFELWVRSISRLTGASSQEILAGKVPVKVIQEANQKYIKIAENIWTIDADINSSLEEIAVQLSKILQNINKKPVLILDNLQRIFLKNMIGQASSEIRLQIIYNLHNWTRQWGIPVLLAANCGKDELLSDLLATVDVYIYLERKENDLTIEINKNRNGNVGTLSFNFDSRIGYMTENSKNTDI